MLENTIVFPEAKPHNPKKNPILPLGFDPEIKPIKDSGRKLSNKEKYGNFNPNPLDLSKVLVPGKNNEKMRRAFELCIKYNGDLRRAAIEVGYRENANLSSIIRSQSWKRLIEFYFPTVLLFEKGRELLEDSDWRARNAQLDRIHKLKGDFNRKVDVKINPHGDLSEKSNEELQRIIDGDFDIVDSETVDSEDGDPLLTNEIIINEDEYDGSGGEDATSQDSSEA